MPSPAEEGDPQGRMRGVCTVDPHQSVVGATDSFPPPGGSHARERLHFYILNPATIDGARTAVV